ncbi:hypothetical protein [Modicisalibacter sp. MOD 31.J]|uniref:hypothetical protein n=1 Tax=Modicisalibacter sp. MOD 31.J TaxID=2831897 RepID=UPI001CCA6A73|nr:hypothetical protein [Modicisalibacter sp. MOD 31.J]MBZ9574576.1 hypothetical protein [Modicisalibacter sp. MOD 31.J]
MPEPNERHPYTNRPNSDYVTVVLERLPLRTPDEAKRGALYDSLRDGTECAALPGYRVTAIAVGDELSEAEIEQEEGDDD